MKTIPSFTKAQQTLFYKSFLITILAIISNFANAATFYSRVSGNFNAATTWSNIICTGPAAASTPTAGDDVIICSGNIVTIPANVTCLNLTINAGGTLSIIGNFTLTIAAGGSITNSGTINGAGGATAAITYAGGGNFINNGSLTLTTGPILNVNAGDVGISGTSLAFNVTTVNVASGYTLTNTCQGIGLTVTTDIAGTGTFANGTNGILNIGKSGTALSITNFDASATGNTVNYTYSGAQTITVPSIGNYYNLTLRAIGVKTITNAVTAINGSLTVSGLVTFSPPVNALTTIGGDLVIDSTAVYTASTNTTINGNVVISNAGATNAIFNGGNNLVHRVKGSWTNNGSSTNNYTFTGTNRVEFAPDISAAYNIGGTAISSFGDVYFHGFASSCVTATYNINPTSTPARLNLTGDMYVYCGNITINPSANVVISNNGAAAGILDGSPNVNQTLNVTSIANSLPGDFSAQYIFTTSHLSDMTVNYSGAGNQTINATGANGIDTYMNLMTSGSGTKSLGGSIDLNYYSPAGITIGNGTALDAASSGNNINLYGDWNNNGSFVSNTAKVSFISSNGNQAIGGTSATDFYNIDIGNTYPFAGYMFNLYANVNVNGVLNFLGTNTANVYTNASTLTINNGAAASITGPSATTGHIIGNLARNINTGVVGNFVFDLGDASNYLPTTISTTTVINSGYMQVKLNSGTDPNLATSEISSINTVNRYWTLSSFGGLNANFDAQFTFSNPGDYLGSPNPLTQFVAGQDNAAVWTYPLNISARTATSTDVIGLTTTSNMGDFSLGDANPPTFATQPADVTACMGDPVTFTSLINGYPSSAIQWQQSTDGGSTWSNIAGETSANYNIPSVSIENGYQYRVNYTNPSGSINSAVATLTVNAVIISTISNDQTICSGSAAAILTGIASGGNGAYTYQWQSAAAIGGPYSNIVGETSSTYDPGTLTTTTYYQRVVSAGVCAASNGNPITITVEQPIANNTISADQNICSGTSPLQLTGASPTGGNSTYTYQWESSTDGGTTWSPVPTATLNNYSPGVLAVTTLYRRNVTAGICPISNSNQVTITVDPVISNNTISSDQNICQGTAPAAFTGTAPTGGNGTYTYVWESSTNALTWTPIAAATAATYAPGILNVTTYYRRNVMAGVCSTDISNYITITVYLPIVNNIIGSNQNICSGSAPATLNGFAPTGGNGIYTFQWQSAAAIGGPYNNIAGATSITYAPPALATTSFYQRVVNSGPCGPDVSNPITITVEQPIAANTILSDQTICNDGISFANLTGSIPSGGNGSYSYQWQSAAAIGGPYNNIAGATVADYSTTPLTTTSFYQRVVTAGACPASISNQITVTVEQPIANNTIAADQNICSGAAPIALTGTAPTGGNGTYTYQWQSAAAIGGPYNNIAGATAATYAPPTLTTTSYYQRVVSAGICNASTSNAITISVDQPIANNTIATNQNICSGTAPATLTGTVPTGGNGAYTYQWQSAAAIGGPYNNIAGATAATYAPTTLTTTSYYQRIVSAGACNASTSNAVTISVDQPIANNTIAADQNICSGAAPASLTGTAPTGGNGAYTYQWQSAASISGPYSNIAGATAATYAPTTLTTTSFYQRVVTAGVCAPNVSNPVTITVEQPIAANTILSDQTICNDGVSFATLTGSTPTGGNGSYTYQWQSAAAIGGPYNNIAGATAASYSTTPLTTTSFYQRVVTAGACPASISNQITITVSSGIGNNIISPNQTICSGNVPTPLTGTVPTGGTGTYSYQWQSSASFGGPFNDIAGATTDSYAPPALTSNTFYIRTVSSGLCNPSSGNVIFIAVEPPIGNNTITANQSICNDGTSVANLSGTTPTGGAGTYTFQWQSAPALNGPYADIAGATAANYSTTPLTTTSFYQRIVMSGTCANNNGNQITITVDQPLGNNIVGTDQTICYHSAPATLTGTIPTGGNGTYNFQWQSATAFAGPYSAITGANAANYQPGNLTAPAFFQRIVSAGPCPAINSNIISIDIIEPKDSFPTLNPQICLVTVDSITGKNLIAWNHDNSTHIQGYNIYRQDTTKTLIKVGTVGKTHESSFLDPTADPKLKSYIYQITALDSCNNESDTSLSKSVIIHRTIHLSAAKGSGHDQILTWNSPNGHVKNYKLYREVTKGKLVLFATLDTQITTYTDTAAIAAKARAYLVIAASLDTCLLDFINGRISQRSMPSDSRSNFEVPIGTDTTSTDTLGSGLGINRINPLENLQLYPNPTNGKFTINANIHDLSNLQIIVSDMIGNILIKKDFIADGQAKEFDLTQYAKGVYFIKIKNQNNQIIKRIVKD